MKLKNIPNYLSIMRLLLVGVFVAVFFCNYPNNCIWAAAVYLLAGLTDILDGWLARHFGWTTRLGRILDPVADKMLQLTVLVCLGIVDLLPFWLIIPFICKELLQLILGFIMIKTRNVVVKSSWYGKAVTVLMCFAAVSVLILAEMIDKIRIYVNIMYAVLMVFTITAIILYTIKYIGINSEEEDDNARVKGKR